jgi:dTDP-4-dehydrorhamnose reductase
VKRVNGRLIQISTDYVFSGEKGNYVEEDKRDPINIYGKTKREAEDIIMNSEIDYTIIRTSGIFGINEATGKTNFFLWVYRNLREKREIQLVKDQFYSPTLNTFLARAIKEIYERDLSGIFHFSSQDRISRYDFGILVSEIFNLEKYLIKEAYMSDMMWIARRPKDSSLNNKKSLLTLNNRPVNVKDEIKFLKESLGKGIL